MIIKSVHIKRFRGFNEVFLKLGNNLTVIAGQNGTQKTTLLGIITQPFTITDKKNPLYGEKPLSGGNFKSLFSEKFKLSDTFDLPKKHEWTLNLTDAFEPEFTVESINRDSKKTGIRFWKKGDRSKGSGYIQIPVVYLSLSRLLPIGEDSSINSSNEISLTKEEFEFYQTWHNKILIIPDLEMVSADYLTSKQKNTLGVNTSFYDWKMNSAGQDNIGKIILAILSFKRLKEKYGDAYQGGILAIDEIDATLYPASQVKLLEALRRFSSKFKIQIIFTTHSLNILNKTCGWQEDPQISRQIKVIYLEKSDSGIKAIENVPYEVIKNKLNVALALRKKVKKIPLFTEDKEAQIFLKAILKRKTTVYKSLDCTLGCDNFIELSRKKINGFNYPESIIAVDGDVRKDAGKMRKINQFKNFLILPGKDSPERLLAEFLHGLSDDSEYWNNIYTGYSKQHVFKDFSLYEIRNNREKAKEWFNSQKIYWGRNCSKVINLWIIENEKDVNKFLHENSELVEKYEKLLLN
jgi:hypothetical protein